MSLEAVVAAAAYKPGWRIGFVDDAEVSGYDGRLRVVARTLDSRSPAHPVVVEHWITVPDGDRDDDRWARWLLDQLVKIETHEACEFFTVDGHRPFYPCHGLDDDPYTIRPAHSG